ncbi:toxin-antitoxin system YwqK family antitoxin [Flavobacterium terrisoli]|uniref:toxin-antitoxin system YwqK family antitoxin n=1 Tax=Flavobacterium terrisoli TaxID=3242195 RepID=UPI0025430CF6|nr:toxin-antitoxin system YwqK family antitoxin [Flavobacterium buctense]
MKQTVFISFFLFFFIGVQSQEKVYFDKDWKPSSKENALYYRIVKKEIDLYLIKDYFIDGKIQFEGYSKVAVDPLVHEGVAQWYYHNGAVERRAEFKNNNPNGRMVTYYSDGKLQSEVGYNNGILDGFSRNYFPNGKMQAEVEFVNGKMNGRYIKYKNESNLKELMHFKNGVFDGPIETYEKGFLSYKAMMKDDFPEGEVIKNYYESGKIQYKYKLSNRVLEYFYGFSMDGDTVSKGIFKEGKPQFYEKKTKMNNSTFFSKMQLVKGIENWKIYRDGKLIVESFYQDGKMIGTWKYYNYDGSKLYYTLDFSKSDCSESNIQKMDEFRQYFTFTDRFEIERELFEIRCKELIRIDFFNKDGANYEDEHPYYYIKWEAEDIKTVSKRPSISYKSSSVEKDGDGYAITRREGTFNEDFDYHEPLNNEFVKKNDCKNSYSNQYKDVLFCEKTYGNIKYKFFASENIGHLAKLKNELAPKNDEILFFYQKFEERIYKKGEKAIDRFLSFKMPNVIKEAFKKKILDDLDVVYVLESLFFEPENFSGTGAYEALKEELKKNE